jgi:hypothetical protein
VPSIFELSSKIDVLSETVESIKQQISDALTQRISTNENNLEAHSERFDAVEAGLRDLRNETEATAKANDLLIKGVPMLNNDSPIEYYCRIATVIGYSSEYIPHAEIFRLEKKKNASGYEPPILVKFSRLSARNALFRSYFQHRNLNLSEIAFMSNTRIYITENMTGHNLEIYKAALKLRHEKKIHSVSTSRRSVMVRFREDDNLVAVTTMAELSARSQE